MIVEGSRLDMASVTCEDVGVFVIRFSGTEKALLIRYEGNCCVYTGVFPYGGEGDSLRPVQLSAKEQAKLLDAILAKGYTYYDIAGEIAG